MRRCSRITHDAILALAVALTPAVALAEISGPARVVDGDTLEVAGERIRLYAIDAPEKDQTCSLDGRAWACGIAAWGDLVQFTAGKEVVCEPRDTDRYGRTVAACTVDGTDLGDWLVRNGWAIAYYLYSYEYTRAEHHAKTNRLGLWAGEFVFPWDWRRGERLQAEAANDDAPADCLIKGNVSNSGERIYHVPGGAYYDHTKISPAKGERWFCSETEALAAGWRKSKR